MTIKKEIKNLFLQKRFSEIIFLIESKFEEKTPEILNILAISRLSQQRRSGEYDANFIYYRYSEILLMKAECLAEKGNFADANSLADSIWF